MIDVARLRPKAIDVPFRQGGRSVDFRPAFIFMDISH